MKRIVSLFLLLAVSAAIFACGSARGGGGASPTEAYTNLFNAVKAKDTEAIKANMTKRSLQFAERAAHKYNTAGEKVLESGCPATTYSPTLPEIRDERINGNMGAIEVWNARDSKWEDLPFIFEDGAWRLAVGDQFADSYRLPAKGRDFREREAANALSNTMIEVSPQGNANLVPMVPKPAPDAQ